MAESVERAAADGADARDRQLEALLKQWGEATAPLDVRRPPDPALFPLCPLKAGSGSKRDDSKLCRPWDHAAFLARVASFQIATWFAKPAAINPFECARHGWRNSQPDFLFCTW